MTTPEQFAARLARLRSVSGKSYRRLGAETGLGYATVAGYCTGRHLPQLAVTGQFTRLLTALGVPQGEEQEEWLRLLRELRSGTRSWQTGDVNPYPGLSGFEVADAGYFHGREDVVARIVTILGGDAQAAVIVVGASGTGKSSLLRAGLVPVFGESAVLSPGRSPLAGWAASTADLAPDALVVVDQLEELFTVSAAAERDSFLSAALAWPGKLVLALRADFYDRATAPAALAPLLQRHQVVLGSLTEPQLRAAITAPAQAAGLRLDDGLVEMLLADCIDQPGALPLLSHALRTMVELARRHGFATELDLAAYRAAGGLGGAVAQTADRAYRQLAEEQQVVARSLFLRLVNIGDGFADTRRRVTTNELFDGLADAEADRLVEVVGTFVAIRLLTAHETTVELSHESLLTAWPRLATWLDDDRAGRRLHRRLTAAAHDWAAEGRTSDGLYHGRVLDSLAEWAAQDDAAPLLNAVEREFLDASLTRRSARATEERRRLQRRYQLLCLALVLFLAAVGAGVVAFRSAADATRQEQLGQSRRAAATAARLREKDPALAAQVALAAYRLAPTTEATSALLDATARPTPMRMRAPGGAVTALATARSLVAAGTAGGTVQLYRTGNGPPSPAGAVLHVDGVVDAVALDPAGVLLAAGTSTGALAVWRISDPEHPVALGSFTATGPRVFGLAFNRPGTVLAAGRGDGTTLVWAMAAGSRPITLTGPAQAVTSVVFTPAGTELAAGSDDSAVYRWDLADLARPRPLPRLTGPAGKIFSIAVSPDGRVLAAGSGADHSVHLWNIADPEHPRPDGGPLTGPASWINSVAFSPDGTRLAAAGSDTKLWQWDLRTRQPIGTLPHTTQVLALVFEDDLNILTTATDGVLRRWTLPGPLLVGSANQVFSAGFDAAGDRLLVGAGDHVLQLWRLGDTSGSPAVAAKLTSTYSGDELAGASALSPDGRLVIGGTTGGRVCFWDVTDPAYPTPLGTPLAVARSVVQAIVFSPDSRLIAVSSSDGTVQLVDVTDQRHPIEVMTLPSIGATAYGVRFSPDGHLLAVAGGDGTGYLWDVTDPRAPRLSYKLGGFTGAVYAAAFNAAGTLLAFGGADRSVRLVDITGPPAPRPIGPVLAGPVDEVYELAFTPRGDTLAVSSIDRTIWLWDVGTPGRPAVQATLTAADDGLFTVTYAPDGHTLVAGGRDAGVRLWDTDPGAAARMVCTTTGEPITREEWDQFLPGVPFTPPC
jgi:WD40 repeat protein